MKKLLSVLSLTLSIILSHNSLAAPPADGDIDTLLAISGLKKQMEQLPGTVRAGIMQARQRGMNVPDAEFTEMVNIIVASFDPSNLMTSIRAELKSTMSTDDITGLLTWYQSPDGKKVTSAEEQASTPQAYDQMIKEASTLLSDEKKLATAKRIEKALSSVDMAMRTQENTGMAVYTAMLTAAEPDKPVNLDAFKTQMAAQMPQIRGRMEQLILLSLIFSYQTLDDSAMEKYISFLEKPVTRKFIVTVTDGMNMAITKYTDIMARDLANLFAKFRKKPDNTK